MKCMTDVSIRSVVFSAKPQHTCNVISCYGLVSCCSILQLKEKNKLGKLDYEITIHCIKCNSFI